MLSIRLFITLPLLAILALRECHSQWIPIKDMTKLITLLPAKAGFSATHDLCKRMGAEMLSIAPNELSQVFKELWDTFGDADSQRKDYWIGARRLGSDLPFRWEADDTLLVLEKYNISAVYGLNCLQIRTGHSQYINGINSGHCLTPTWGVCQKMGSDCRADAVHVISMVGFGLSCFALLLAICLCFRSKQHCKVLKLSRNRDKVTGGRHELRDAKDLQVEAVSCSDTRDSSS